MGSLDFLSTDYQFKKYKNVYAGMLQGFYTIFRVDTNAKKCILTIGASKEADGEDMLALLQPRLCEIKKVKTRIDNATLILEYPIPALGNYKKTFNLLNDTVIPFLVENKYKSGGFIYGKNDGTIRLFQIGQQYLYLTEAERAEKEADLTAQKEKDKNTQENFLLGTIGVIGVALAGIILYVIVGKMNLYVWAIPALLSAISYAVYKRLGKKTTVKAIVMIFIVLCIALAAATVLEYGWRIYEVVHENPDNELISFFDVLKETPDLIFIEPDIAKLVRRDLLVNGGILILASILTMVIAYRQEVRFIEIKRLD